MATTNLVPIFTPEGNLAKVPAENMSDAMQQGYKIAVSVTSPEGNAAWVPNDKAHDAIAQGFKLGPPQQQKLDPDPTVGTPYEGYARLGQGVKDAVTGLAHLPGALYHAVADAPKNQDEQSEQNIGGPGALAVKRLVTDPMAADFQKGKQDVSQGHYSEAGGHFLASGLPGVGAFASHSGEAIGQDPLRGGAELLTNLAAPKVLGEGLKAVAPVVTDATSGIRNAASDALDSSAKADLGKVLVPTKQATKFIAKEKVIPGMQDRGITAMTAKGLQDTAASKMEDLGQKIDDAYDAQPAQPSIPTQPIIDKLEAYKKNFVNDVPALGNQPAKSVVMDQGAIDRIQDVQNKIAEHGDALDPQSMRNLRQYLDTNVANGKGYAGKTMAEGHSLEIQKQAANAIRGQLADAVPGLGDLNSEFSFWKNLNDVMEQTAQRRTGQQGGGLGRKIATGTGTAVGAHLGGPAGALIGAEAGNFLSRLTSSTAWNTISAKLKTGLSKALADRDPVAVNQAIGKIQSATVKQPAAGAATVSTSTPAQQVASLPAPRGLLDVLGGGRRIPSPEEPPTGSAPVAPATAPQSLANILSGQPEDRTNVDYRAAVDKMTPEQKVQAIFRNKLSDLPNDRAYDLAKTQLNQTHPHVGFADIDDFKDLNTKLGEPGVDSVIFPAMGDLVKDAIAKENGAVHAFHVHGDEFNFLGQQPEAISRVVGELNSRLKDATFSVKRPDGTIAESKVTGFSHGTGPDEASAAAAEKLDKQRRKDAGIRKGDRDKTQDQDTRSLPNPSRQYNPVNDSGRKNLSQSSNTPGTNQQENSVNQPSLADILSNRKSAPQLDSGRASIADILSSKQVPDNYAQAKQIVQEFGTSSSSLLQRKLRIPYKEAAALQDRMFADGLTDRTGNGAKWKGGK